MKPEEPFFCKHCGNPEKHDRRVCHGRAHAKALMANPVWKAAHIERSRILMREMWAKARATKGT